MVEITDPDTKQVWDYHIDKRLFPFLENIKQKINKRDQDYVLVIDGYEGSGKSTFAQQLARYIDNGMSLDRICMTANEFKQAIINAKPHQCVIYDEAVTGMTAGDSITRIGKVLKSMMMQMRQKNLFVIVIIPTIFELNRYSILFRAKCLFHIYERHGERGYFVGYNKKDLKMLYMKGKKYYSYKVKSLYNGRFYGKYTVNETDYRKKKEEALFKIDDETKEAKMNVKEGALMSYLKDLGISAVEIAENMTKRGYHMVDRTVYRHINAAKEGNIAEI